MIANTYRYTYLSARRDGFSRRAALRLAIADLIAGTLAVIRRVP